MPSLNLFGGSRMKCTLDAQFDQSPIQISFSSVINVPSHPRIINAKYIIDNQKNKIFDYGFKFPAYCYPPLKLYQLLIYPPLKMCQLVEA